jgi:hypothetical protein
VDDIAGALALVREAMTEFNLSSRVEPNETIEQDRVFFPDGHRGVLDLRRQLVVGNRGMGKSFWCHALLNEQLRGRLSQAYSLPALSKTVVVVGFNGSDKLSPVAPATDEIKEALARGADVDLLWRAVLVRAARAVSQEARRASFLETLAELKNRPTLYTEALSTTDEILGAEQRHLTIVFDALDRLAPGWEHIQALTRALLVRSVGLQSFRKIQAKIFMRVDQFADTHLFRFPDSSKLINDRVDLNWRPHELYGLLLFEILRKRSGGQALHAVAYATGTLAALPLHNQLNVSALQDQERLINAMSGEFMGGHKKRGRVYTWVPLHLSDAANTCSPRTFLTAWKSAADHLPHPADKAVDHLGLIDGVRQASSARLTELREDYPWIDAALEPLRRQFVPIAREDLFALWDEHNVVNEIIRRGVQSAAQSPLDLFLDPSPYALLQAMTRIAVMEERANGKINVPDIFRVEAQILRKGGVAVPRRSL